LLDDNLVRGGRKVESGLVEDVFGDDGAVEDDPVIDEEAVFAVGLDEDGELASLGEGVIAGPFVVVGGADVGVGALGSIAKWVRRDI
jgi:hypothetical protein